MHHMQQMVQEQREPGSAPLQARNMMTSGEHVHYRSAPLKGQRDCYAAARIQDKTGVCVLHVSVCVFGSILILLEVFWDLLKI